MGVERACRVRDRPWRRIRLSPDAVPLSSLRTGLHRRVLGAGSAVRGIRTASDAPVDRTQSLWQLRHMALRSFDITRSLSRLEYTEWQVPHPRRSSKRRSR